MGSPRGWDQAEGSHGRLGWEAGGQGRCGENEGGWSIPEAAGAKGCLLGCAGPTRGSFVQGSNPSWGQKRNGTREGGWGAQPDPKGPPLQTLKGKNQAEGGLQD